MNPWHKLSEAEQLAHVQAQVMASPAKFKDGVFVSPWGSVHTFYETFGRAKQ